MLLFWRIRYLDTRDKEFKDRDLWLRTEELDPATKAAVELCHDAADSGNARDMLRYRRLFREEDYSNTELKELCELCGRMSSFCLHDYFEDENGKELPRNEMVAILTGDPTAVMLPPGAKQHDIDFFLAERTPIPLGEVLLSSGQLEVLGYFARDLQELVASAFYRDGPGALSGTVQTAPALQTAVTDEEIRSFTTIFRRLYMESEPANLMKAVKALSGAIEGYPLGKWLKGAAAEYELLLNENPHFAPFLKDRKCPFSRKRLIDVFLYTRYAHQPSVKRVRQFQKCLADVDNQGALLTWLFLYALWTCSRQMCNTGRIIVRFYQRYCEHHAVTPDVLGSVSSDNPGIGTLEKKEDRIERILNEKADELARAIWTEGGCPSGGPGQFLAEAREQLRSTLE